MAGQVARVIPGIPLAALDSISDKNTREVLRAIVDGWHVRNGSTGNGDERFVTASEVGLAKGRSAIGGDYGNQQSPASSNPTLTPSQISRVINDLQAQVIESPLFKALGDRVDLIDAPGGLAEGIATETQLRMDSDNALASAITTIWTSIGNALGLVQTGTEIVVNDVSAAATNFSQVQAAVKDSDGNIIASSAIRQVAQSAASLAGVVSAKYTVTIDQNGYVSGFGLASNADNSTPFSEFVVRADRFAIGSPSAPGTAPGIAPKVPFIVTTTPQIINGTVVPPGVYIDAAFIKAATITSAMIADAAITNAKIGTAEIGTLKIAGNAITVPLVVTSSLTTPGVGAGIFQTVLSGSITLSQAGTVFAASTGLISYGTGWVNTNSRLLINGAIVSAGGGAEAWVNAVHSGGLNCGAGLVTVQLQFESTGSGSRIVAPSLFIQGAMR